MKTALVVGMLAIPVWAQNVDQGDDPDHGVARISMLSGDVTVQRGDTGEVVAAELNAPLVSLDHVLTGPNSRAEVQFDYANMIRLNGVSEVRMAELHANDYFVQIAEGTITFRVLRDTDAQVEISTPTVSVIPTERGVYRITVRPDGGTEVTVRSGQAEIHSPRGTEILGSGKTLQARGTPENPDFMILSAIGKDDWDRWNDDRDRDLERSTSYQYVSHDIYGADDLDNNGRWVYDSPYGWVWVPNVSATWAPYRVGRWSWVNFYGWTWVSGDPWGWAPYHYGSWYSSSYGWAWYPGSVGPRYYWRPALVTFFGWGNGNVNLNVGIGGGFGYGNVGWVPLAPYEVYNPWYGPRYRNTTIINNYTVINNTNMVNTYRNARQLNGRDGVTSVQAGNFGRGRVDNTNYLRVSNNDLSRAGQVRGVVPVEQNRDSRRFTDRNPTADATAQVNNTRNRQFATADRSRRGGTDTNTNVVTSPSPNRGNTGNRGASIDPAQATGSRRLDPTNSGNTPVDRSGVSRGGDIREIGSSNNTPANQGRPVSITPAPSAPANDGRSRRGGEYAPRAGQPVDPTPVGTTNNGPRRETQPVQVNPPIVRDRGNNNGNSGATGPRPAAPSMPNNGGGPVQSTPRAAPASAPARGNGGGGVDRGTASRSDKNQGNGDKGGDRRR